MKLKLDENLGERSREILSNAGHDVATVAGQGLQETEDADLIERCRHEGRALVSLDVDFANPLRFRPSRYAGIAVLRFAVQTLTPDSSERRPHTGRWSAARKSRGQIVDRRDRQNPSFPGRKHLKSVIRRWR